MVRTAQNGHETGCLFKKQFETAGLVLQRYPCQMLLGYIVADNHDTTNAIFNINGSVAIGPPDIFLAPMTGNRHEAVLIPGRSFA